MVLIAGGFNIKGFEPKGSVVQQSQTKENIKECKFARVEQWRLMTVLYFMRIPVKPQKILKIG